MKIERTFYLLVTLAATGSAIFSWMRAEKAEQESAAIRAEASSKAEEIAQANSAAQAGKAETEKLRGQTTELMRLRNEVTQLRPAAKNAIALQAEIGRLRQENLQLRGQAASPADGSAQPETPTASPNHFPRQNWTFAGYGSPEAALVSALWSMKEGNPSSYLNGLSQEEQERMAKVWENKSEQEIISKHQSDVASITGLKIVDSQSVSPTETVMDVVLEGANRSEKVRMTRVGEDWKFGGYIR